MPGHEIASGGHDASLRTHPEIFALADCQAPGARLAKPFKKSLPLRQRPYSDWRNFRKTTDQPNLPAALCHRLNLPERRVPVSNARLTTFELYMPDYLESKRFYPGISLSVVLRLKEAALVAPQR